MTEDNGSSTEMSLFKTPSDNVAARTPKVGPRWKISAIQELLRANSFDSVASIAVCDQGRLIGLVRVEDVLAARPESTAEDIMVRNPPVVAFGTDQEAAAWQAVQRGESTLAVVADDGRFVGLIPADRLLAILLAEHDEDMVRLGGFLKGASLARTASREPVRWRLWHRLPWLMVGLAGAFVAADIVGSFETELKKNVILAFFLPGIVYMADAVGTQTETLVVRGLSVGIPIKEVVRRELMTGFLVGLMIALTFVPVALWRWGGSEVVVVVAVSLFAACSIATLVAMLLPWLLHRFGRDPAFGSGPLATVVQDILSVLIYFFLAIIIID